MHRIKLNSRQLDLLRRIDEGTEPVTSREYTLATSVYALRNRNLVTTKRSQGIWAAAITDTGRYYLKHGHPEVRDAGPATSRLSTDQAGRTGQRLAMAPAELLERLDAAGGSIRIADPSEDERAAWRRAIHAARTAVPDEKRLWMKGRGHGDVVVRLGPRPKLKPTTSRAAVPSIPVPERLLRPHPMVARLKVISSVRVRTNAWGRPEPSPPGDLDRLDVSRPLLPRALRIMQALVTEAEARGYEIRAVSVRGRRDVNIAIKGHEYAVRIREKGGLLQLTLPREYSGRRLWTDGARATLERKLGHFLANIEGRAAEAEERRLEHERREEERRRAWEQAMETARANWIENHRAKVLHDQITSWRLAAEIREFCNTAQTAANAEHSDPAREDEWLAWAARYADAIDPLQRPLVMPESPEPSPEDLRPYMRGWDPYGMNSWR